MSGFELADAEARRTVTQDLARNLFVEAGAGSGKTRSLVERVVSLVQSGERIEQIAAITFTEAAATELRSRIREALESRLTADTDRRFSDALSNIEAAPITTLHGFALRILMDHPVEAGLPPGFSVADEISSLVAFDKAWQVFAGNVGDDLDLLDLQSLASVLSVRLKSFREVARKFDDNWDLLEGVELCPPAPDLGNIPALLDEIADLVSLTSQCIASDDKLVEAIVRLGEHAVVAKHAETLEQIERLRSLPWPKGNIGRKPSWRTDLDSVRATLAAKREQAAHEVDQIIDAVLQHYLALVAQFVTQRTDARRAEGNLSFHDLLVIARRLLRNNEAVRLRLHQQYRRLLLDEFQDTDPIQIELAVLLASPAPPEGRPWTDLAGALPPGRLVVVGDPKQSIYRFRRADIGVYTDAERTLVSETTRLVTNFRSVPGIVDLVNHLFTNVIGAGIPGVQPAYTPLVSNRLPDASSGPPVVVVGGPHGRDLSAGDMRVLEADDIAAVICRAMAERWPVFGEGGWRTPRLSDIAILVPSRLMLPALESSLSAVGLPFRPETSSLVYATQEVRDVLAAVRAVVDPASAIDVVAALRSALFAITDQDLLAWHLAGRSWDFRQPRASVDDPTCASIAAAFDVLAGWHEDRWWLAPSQFLERVVRDRRLREQTLARSRPRDHWRRYRFIVEQARAFSATVGGDLVDFVGWAELQASDSARVSEPIPAESDDDAVRILTIHGSKGLEFPITVLAGASTEDQKGARGPVVIFPPGEAPQVKLRADSATADYDIHASVEELLDQNERVRLQYVAATRARDRLVLSAHHKEGKSCMGSRVHSALADRPDLWVRFEADGTERHDVQPPTQLRFSPGDFEGERRVWQAEQDVIEQTSQGARTRSATAVAAALAPQPLAPLAEAEDESRPWRRGRAGTAIGSAVHAVLQHVDLLTGADVNELSALHAEREGIARLAPRVAELVRVALGSATVRRAAQSRHWRELHIAVPVTDEPRGARGLLEGYIDLLFEADDGLIIVDFKTDPVRHAADAQRHMNTYRYQGASYALAVHQVTGRPVVDCRFLFLAADSLLIEQSVPDLDRAVDEVRWFLR